MNNTTIVEPKILWTLIDDGRSNEEIFRNLEAKDIRVGNCAEGMIAKSDEPIPLLGTEYRLVGINRNEFTDAERSTRNIFVEGERRNYFKPPLRVAFLLREKFSQEELGFPYIVVVHKYVRDYDEGPDDLLALYRSEGHEWLRAWHTSPAWRMSHDNELNHEHLFVFLAPEKPQYLF